MVSITSLATWVKVALILGVLFIALLVTLHLLASSQKTKVDLEHSEGHKRLVVLVHGLTGLEDFKPAVHLAREALPKSDLLIFDFDSGVFSNTSPYAIANSIEKEINKAHIRYDYEEIILVGHSMGGMLLRKAIVWGNGLEDDRHDFGLRGERAWVQKVSRFVSLATINRGWSIDPRPKNMSTATYLSIWLGERLARLSQSAQLLLALQRGAPFVADARVQWIELCRGEFPTPKHVPQTIHLLGDKDDIVSKEDSMDLKAAKDTLFVTLENTGHRDIGTALNGGTTPADQERREAVKHALQGKIELLDTDKLVGQDEDHSIERIVYVMHGIRDYGEWTDQLRTVIEQKAAATQVGLAVVNQKYGHFPMLPFLLFWDRQKNVRLFMDEYTENRAKYPQAVKFDYVGHSNGTYILASALYKYKTLKVERVYLAGSVVPKHFKWQELADSGRVKYVANVVAAGDWVVAIFPRFFEQIADWIEVQPSDGPLDIGSGGFRGFQDASDAKKRIENFQFASGAHSAGVDASDEGKLEAIARFVVSGDTSGFTLFRNQSGPEGWLAFLSNVSWLVWLALGALLFGIGLLAFSASPWVGGGYVLILLGLLNSV
ncbi:triacylglycerol lipase [Pseudomonas sp. C2B4]|uniref:esterase/lipase family protein n=1 Tax=Pseudomonas sp. C2B4 TaxID=2735270 RepID=UPI001586877E|nr:alpha/beta hydrolase [Pseudomonas sp. C2B4]NUU37690.1 alpha/beta hydrolase [Pseudomonas sp. C2B4]